MATDLVLVLFQILFRIPKTATDLVPVLLQKKVFSPAGGGLPLD